MATNPNAQSAKAAFDMNAFFQQAGEVQLTIPLGTHEATFLGWEPATSQAINLIIMIDNKTYKDFRTAQSLAFATRELEQQLNTGISDPVQFLQAIQGTVVTVTCVETPDPDSARTFRNIRYANPVIPSNASSSSNPTQPSGIKTSDL